MAPENEGAVDSTSADPATVVILAQEYFAAFDGSSDASRMARAERLLRRACGAERPGVLSPTDEQLAAAIRDLSDIEPPRGWQRRVWSEINKTRPGLRGWLARWWPWFAPVVLLVTLVTAAIVYEREQMPKRMVPPSVLDLDQCVELGSVSACALERCKICPGDRLVCPGARWP